MVDVGKEGEVVVDGPVIVAPGGEITDEGTIMTSELETGGMVDVGKGGEVVVDGPVIVEPGGELLLEMPASPWKNALKSKPLAST
jgi:hypothetical protein